MARWSLKKVRRGDAIKAEHINAIIERLDELEIRAASPLQITRVQGSGALISLGFGFDLFCVFELTSQLNPGSYADAKILWDVGKAGTWGEDGDTTTIQVNDAIETFTGEVGDRGIAKFDRQSGLWVVLNLKC